MDLIRVPVTTIYINPTYHELFPALSQDLYDDLKRDIARSGIMTPPVIGPYNGPESTLAYEMLSGENRLKIAIELGHEFLTCFLAVTPHQRISALFDNIHRRQLDHNTLLSLRKKETHLRKHLLDKVIPSLQPIFGMLTPELQNQILLSSEEAQEELLLEVKKLDVQKTKGKPASGPAVTKGHQETPAERQVLELKQELARVQEEFAAEQRDHIRRHNTIVDNLNTQRTQTELAIEETQSLRAQLQKQQGEVNAARLFAEQQLSKHDPSFNHKELTPQLFLSWLSSAGDILQRLAQYADKLPALSPTQQRDAQTTLTTIDVHLSALTTYVNKQEEPAREAASRKTERTNLTIIPGRASS